MGNMGNQTLFLKFFGTKNLVLKVLDFLIDNEACVECGERYYSPGVVDRLRNMGKRMDREKLKKLDVIGCTYKVKYNSTF